KTTYYLHMKPRHTAEQSTTRVNKAEALGRRGFAALKNPAASLVDESIPSPIAVEIPVMAAVAEPIAEIREIKEVIEEIRIEEKVFEPAPAIAFAAVATAPAMAAETHIEEEAPIHFNSSESKSDMVEQVANVCPIDPMDKLLCDSCQ